MSVADRAIRVSTAAAVLGVAGIAAYVSYWHAFEVVRAHGETGITARLEPATIDGLVYSSSMVVLYAARHRLPVPGLARWLLALGILATLAANVAHGWSHGPVGAAVAAWPAASLVGSYELLLWLIRTASAGAVARELAAGQAGGPADHPVAGLRLVPAPDTDVPGDRSAQGSQIRPSGPGDRCVGPILGAGWTNGPGRPDAGHAYRPAVQETIGWSGVNGAGVIAGSSEEDVNTAAVAAYRVSIDTGRPLSERKLAAMFGKTSRRWARSRMAEARQPLVSATVDSR
ncbi:MAG: DUF2637 domain-containing protein [Streptosporangiaceae bacterium]